ncbi:Hypothetical predicted protein, partial [Olea europaea subsp. europaea]
IVEPSTVQVAIMVALCSSVFLSSTKDFANASNLRLAKAGLCAQLIEPSSLTCSEMQNTNKRWIRPI